MARLAVADFDNLLYIQFVRKYRLLLERWFMFKNSATDMHIG